LFVIDTAISREKKCDQERSREDSKTQRPYNRNTAHMGYRNKCNTGNNRGKTGTISNPFKKYPSNTGGKHEIKELYKKTPILGSTNVKLQNIQHGK
jgi:hypothetical protein